MKTYLLIFAFILTTFTVDSLASYRHKELKNFERNSSFLSQHHLDNDLVDKWFRYYTGRGKSLFERQIKRGEIVRKAVENVLLEKNLPLEIYYVALIESGFNFKAVSHAGATGPWQFMKNTGRMYGLRVDSKIDERRNIYKSSRAAAEYLSDLHNIFNDWALTLAAYNAGEYRIMNAIRKYNTRDFNKLVKMKALPAETMNYISKVWTAMIVDKNANSFRVKKGKASWMMNPTELSLSLDQNTNVEKLIGLSGLSRDKFYRYNTHLLSNSIAAGTKNPVEIYLPKKNYMRLAMGLYGFKVKPRPKVVPVTDPLKLSEYGFKNITKGEKIEVTRLESGQIKLKRLKNGRIITIRTP
ncbi:MAG: lytic transglycosylase domain-containing protein [Bacteriovoracaceae bacterium]|nr:lytic transglycosylase domain-containing protein [Bacteriovoracaceae bacterium]